MIRVQVVLIDDDDREVGRLDQTTDLRYQVNDLGEHPDERDLWLVCAVEPGEPPYTQHATWIYVGRNDADRRSAGHS